MSYTLTIGGVEVPIRAITLDVEKAIGQRSIASFSVNDTSRAWHFKPAQPIVIEDEDGTEVYTGVVDSSQERSAANGRARIHTIRCTDGHYRADKRRAARSYSNTLAGDMASDLVANYLAAEGVIGQHASRVETSQGDWLSTNGGSLDANLDATTSPGNLSLKLSGGLYPSTAKQRVSPALSLANVDVARVAKLSWTATTPAGTTLLIETSLDNGFSYQTATNGGTIPGITPQSDPFYDGFDSNDSANWAVHDSGTWTWNTAASRLEMLTTPTHGAAITYTPLGISQDCDISATITQADEFGLFARWDNANGRQWSIAARDDHYTGGGGSQIIRVIRYDAGFAFNSLGNIPVSFVRGTSHRLRATFIGGTVTIYWDDIQVAQYTGQPIWAGGVGLATNTSSTLALTGYASDFSATMLGTSLTGLRASDSFDSNSSANYDSSLAPTATWTWNTGSSRLEVLTAATHGGSLTYKPMGSAVQDCDISVTITQADDFGILARVVSGTGQQWVITVRDNSTALGTGGALVVVRLDSGFVYNQLAYIPMSWARGTAHVLRATLIGGTVTVYWDGAQMGQYTGQPVWAGAVGMTSLSAAPAMTGYARDWTATTYDGLSLLVRQTLTANVARTSTPSLADLTVNIKTAQIYDGVLIGQTLFNYAPCSDCLTKLAELSGYYWNIGADSRLQFRPLGTLVAPWPITGGDMLVDAAPPTITYQTPQYRNRQIARGVHVPTSTQTEHRKGDSLTRSYTMSYPIQTAPVITVDGAARTVGIKGIDDLTPGTADFYWSKGDPVIAHDTTKTLLTSGNDMQAVYVGEYIGVITANDLAGQIARAAIERIGTGIVEDVIETPGANSTDEGFALANAKLARYSQLGSYALEFDTFKAGLGEGMMLTTYVAELDIAGDQLLIESVILREDPAYLAIRYHVRAVAGPFNTSWAQFFDAIASQAAAYVDTLNLNGSGTLEVDQTFTATETPTSSFTAIVYVCPLCGPGMLCGSFVVC